VSVSFWKPSSSTVINSATLCSGRRRQLAIRAATDSELLQRFLKLIFYSAFLEILPRQGFMILQNSLWHYKVAWRAVLTVPPPLVWHCNHRR
jgi:hypothetical protein